MNAYRALAVHSLKANLRHRQGIVVVFVLIAGIVPVYFAMEGNLHDILKSPWEVAEPLVGYALGLSGYLISLLCVVFLGAMLGVGTLAQEKAKGVVEALLSAPVGPWGLWWAKVTASFLPAFLIGPAVSFGVLWGLNASAIVPVLGRTYLPGPVVASVLLGVPLLGLGLTALVNLLGLVLPNPNLASLGVVAVVVAISNILPPLGLSFADWAFAYANAGAGAGFLAISLLSARFILTKQRIILSARRL